MEIIDTLKSNFKKKVQNEKIDNEISKDEINSDSDKTFTDLWSFRSKKRQKL